ncbi:MAG TPA: ABC transporter permease [Puia sp.]|nr:ABC transporter permease [Puia sp.]
MLLNYLLIALRNIRRHLGYTLINVSGLALGVASCLLIFLVVRYELGYDAFYAKADRIYRVNHHSIDYNPRTSPAVAPALRHDFPELQVAQFFYDNGMVKIGTDRYNEENYAYADEWVPRMFDYHWISGNPNTALSAPNQIVLTERMAKKYFGAKDAMGQTVKVDNQFDCTVTGIIKDLPGNTSLPFRFLISLSTLSHTWIGQTHEYFSIPGGNYTFIALPAGYPVERVRARIKAFLAKNWGNDIAKQATLILQPLRDVHFDQQYLFIDLSPTTSRQTYYALAGIALFILITACINFINLATGQAVTRAREVGVRKVLGARRPQLIVQFLGETALQVLAAIVLGWVAAALLAPQLGDWLDIGIGAEELEQPVILGLLAGLAGFIVVVAGLYPAFVQSAFQPVTSLKGTAAPAPGGLTLRRGLVILQFGISQLMIIGTIVVARQMDFFQNRDLGFNKDFVIQFGLPDSAHRQVLWHQLSAMPGITDVSFSSGAPPYMGNASDYDDPDRGITGENITEIKFVDEHYIRMFGLHMLAGDTIARRPGKDSIQKVVVNETLIQGLNIPDPHAAVGHMFEVSGTRCQVIGVVQDFQSESKHKKRRACVLLYLDRNFWAAAVRLDPHNIKATIAQIDKIWSALSPNDLFQYEFLDDHIATFYRQEQKVYTAFRLFSCIAIFVGCLGLYGLIAFATLQRTREVGIRKVLGATVPDILFLFGREFIVLILLAFVVAAPVAWLAMHSWLEGFAYRIGIGWGTFVVSLAASFVIAACTISYKSIAAAVANPVRSLRTE